MSIERFLLERGVFMINNKKKNAILDYLSDAESRTFDDLTKKFGVSLNTMRKYINELAEENYVQKFYGGVSLAKKDDSNYHRRVTVNLEDKQKIAEAAAKLINNNDIIFIDSGSTTSLLVDYLNRNDHLTIVTNNLHVTNKIMDIPNWNLIIVGSTLRHSSHSLVNVPSWDYLQSLNLNKAFLATTGLTIKSGATNTAREETIIKSRMMGRCHERFLLMDASKFDHTSLLTFASIDEFNAIITADRAPSHYREYCRNHNIKLIIA